MKLENMETLEELAKEYNEMEKYRYEGLVSDSIWHDFCEDIACRLAAESEAVVGYYKEEESYDEEE